MIIEKIAQELNVQAKQVQAAVELLDGGATVPFIAPMARALLKKEVGDEAMVKTEAGVFYWTINSIEYEK